MLSKIIHNQIIWYNKYQIKLADIYDFFKKFFIRINMIVRYDGIEGRVLVLLFLSNILSLDHHRCLITVQYCSDVVYSNSSPSLIH